MKLWDFFDSAYYEYQPKLDLFNTVQELTDNFDEAKLNMICDEFDFYCFMKKEEWLGSFEDEEVQKAMHKLEKEGKKVPMITESKRSPLSVSHFFKNKKYENPKIKNLIKSENELTDKQKNDRDKFLKKMIEQRSITIDVEKLMDPHNVEFSGLYRLRNILIDLKRKHTNAGYKFEDDHDNNLDLDIKNKELIKNHSQIFRTPSYIQELIFFSVNLSVAIYDEEKKSNINDYDTLSKNEVRKKIEKLPHLRRERTIQKFLNEALKSLQLDGKLSLPDSREIYEFNVPQKDWYKNLINNEKFKRNRHNIDAVESDFVLSLMENHLVNKRNSSKKNREKYQNALIQPIHWNKEKESLRQFIQSLKSAGFIESRDTEEIIKEHFDEENKKPVQEPKPINWLKSKVLLAYLINELCTKPKMSKPFIKTSKKQQLIKFHFAVKGKKIERSLSGDLSQSPFPNGSTDIDAILKSLQ